MKHVKRLCFATLFSATYLVGAPMIEHSDAVKILPSQATELTFEGVLRVYSSPLPKGVCILSSLELPVDEEILKNEEAFVQNFESYLVSHLFFNPQVFKQKQKFTLVPGTLHKQPCLQFHFSYIDKGVSKVVNGVALVNDNVLCHLFYITSEENSKGMEIELNKMKEKLSHILKD